MILDRFFRKFRNVYRRLPRSYIWRKPLSLSLRPLTSRLDKYFPTPRTVMISVTDRCQAECRHCAMSMYPQGEASEPSRDDLIRLIDETAALGSKQLYFFGGEPLLRDDLVELIAHGTRKGLKSRLDTNGYLLSKDMALSLKAAGLDMIGVSIDSPTAEAHDAFRRLPGLFEKAVTGVRHCVELGLYCFLSTCSTKKNLYNGYLVNLIKLAESLGVNHMRILFPSCCGEWMHAADQRLDEEDKKRIVGLINDPDFVYFEEQPVSSPDQIYCSCLRKEFIYVSSSGDVQPCPFVPLTFGNYKTTPLSVIVRRIWSHDMMKQHVSDCLMNDRHFRSRFLSGLLEADTVRLEPERRKILNSILSNGLHLR